MPTIRFHGVDNQKVISKVSELQSKLAKSFQTTLDNITIECVVSLFIDAGEFVNNPYPMVEILSFRRNEQIESDAAMVIYQYLCEIGYPHSDVFYQYLSQEGYYVDGIKLESV